MRKFESHVQWLKYTVLKKVIQKTIDGTLELSKHRIPKEIIPGTTPISRCCVYKEREIIHERVAIAANPLQPDEGIIQTIESACDECSQERYIVTDSCRGCVAHRCMQICKRDAIRIVDGRAQIDYSKCVSCGQCKTVCPFNAIVDAMRPCIRACQSKAIEVREDQKVDINHEKCTNCGACVYICPFGAISDKSEMVPIVKALEEAKKYKNINMYAVIAPSIVTQYNANFGQIVAALKKMGFKDVVEAALGADMVAYNEGLEFIERVVQGKETCMMTSCCPSFVDYVKKHYPDFSVHLSTMVSPMIAISRFIKQTDTDKEVKVVFIGPCTAKKEEKRQEGLQDATDYVMTFEELEALIDAYEIDLESCEAEPLNNASYYGRHFARSGGVADAVATIIEKQNIDASQYRPIVCSGIQEVDKALKLLKVKRNTFNFIEGMGCVGGCIGGAACLTHRPAQQKKVDTYAQQAMEKTVEDALRVIDYEKINLHRHH